MAPEKREPVETSRLLITCNHMENNFHLSNKKALFYNMKVYYESLGQDPFGKLPLSFHSKEGLADKEYARFCEVAKQEDNPYF